MGRGIEIHPAVVIFGVPFPGGYTIVTIFFLDARAARGPQLGRATGEGS